MKSVAITTLGCKTNQFESAAMIEQFKNAGYSIVSFSEPADIYVINSCTVTAKTDAETRRLTRRARRLNADAKIVVTGCYAQVAPKELEQLPDVDTILGNMEKLEITKFLETGESLVSDISMTNTAEPLRLESFAEHTRAFLQIQNGCNSFCAYCIVPFARGRSRSVSVEEVLKGVHKFSDNGYREIVLTGIHLGAYGLDLKQPTTLAGLVRSISETGRIHRLRLGSIEPNELDDELLGLMQNLEIICHHFHLPLQSGSNSVLKRMGRRYSTDYFKELVLKIAATLPDAFIGADVIAGFPGETEQEFQETLQLLQELPFSDLHVFPYSRRSGTKAAEMPDQISAHTIKLRARILREVALEKKQIFTERFRGKNLAVLVQGIDPINGLCRGISRNYLNIEFPGSSEIVNREVQVRLDVTGTGFELKGIML